MRNSPDFEQGPADVDIYIVGSPKAKLLCRVNGPALSRVYSVSVSDHLWYWLTRLGFQQC